MCGYLPRTEAQGREHRVICVRCPRDVSSGTIPPVLSSLARDASTATRATHSAAGPSSFRPSVHQFLDRCIFPLLLGALQVGLGSICTCGEMPA
ncbi:hypothetical protein BD311DRAFT_759675 [Dichomitus squalens]|uniref:Uncharacterized protein n=1 Tax=Dichomitus squalens TaxID=114155 RepID=A0A4Q9MLT5_9APHY|nr:hypothetical protein BD311DRAFT_759675 [Dichomitus squalens]